MVPLNSNTQYLLTEQGRHKARVSHEIAVYEVESGCALDKVLITGRFLYLILIDPFHYHNELYHSVLTYEVNYTA